jgi:hypothetical protein
MRVFLRSIRTGLYYAGHGGWSREQEVAVDFEEVDRAAEVWEEDHLGDVEVVLTSESLSKQLTSDLEKSLTSTRRNPAA